LLNQLEKSLSQKPLSPKAQSSQTFYKLYLINYKKSLSQKPLALRPSQEKHSINFA
jgi:hypothetical protein